MYVCFCIISSLWLYLVRCFKKVNVYLVLLNQVVICFWWIIVEIFIVRSSFGVVGCTYKIWLHNTLSVFARVRSVSIMYILSVDYCIKILPFAPLFSFTTNNPIRNCGPGNWDPCTPSRALSYLSLTIIRAIFDLQAAARNLSNKSL